MPVALMGFGTLQSVPLPSIRSLFSFPSRHDVASEPKRRDRCRSHVSARLLAFTGLIPMKVRSYTVRCYPDGAADALLGLFPFKVFSLIASEAAFATPSSCVLEEEPFPEGKSP